MFKANVAPKSFRVQNNKTNYFVQRTSSYKAFTNNQTTKVHQKRFYANDEVKLDPSFIENQINAMLEKEENPHLNDWKKLGVPTQAKVYSFIRDHIGGVPKPYKSKYPNVSLQDVKSQIDEQLSRPVYGIDDPKFRNWIGSLGYSAEEASNLINGRFPVLNVKNPQWDELTAVYSDSNTDMRSWKLISEAVNGLLAPKTISVTEEQNVSIDWPLWESKIGKESAQQMKQSLDEALSAVPNFNSFDVSDVVKDYFHPLFEQMKDEVIDSIPQIKELTDKIIKAGEGKRILEVEQFMHFDRYLDEFIPEIRNEIDLEIDNNDYDWEYNEMFKRDLDSKTPLDFIVSKEALRDSIEAMYEENTGDTVQISSHPERERLIKEWLREQDKSKRLEAELSSMKTTTDTEVHDEDHDKEGEEEEKEEADSEFAPIAKKELSNVFKLEADFWEKLAAEERENRRKERETKGLEKKK